MSSDKLKWMKPRPSPIQKHASHAPWSLITHFSKFLFPNSVLFVYFIFFSMHARTPRTTTPDELLLLRHHHAHDCDGYVPRRDTHI